MLFVNSLYSREEIQWSCQEFLERLKESSTTPFTVYEFLKNDVWCKPYFDYETYLPEETDDAPHVQLVTEAITSFFKDDPAFSQESIALAQRHRWVKVNGCDKFKISLRAYVQGYRIRFTEIKTLIRELSENGESIFDTSVYNNGRLLGVIGGCKTLQDATPLTPITHVDNLGAFLAQHLTGDETTLQATDEESKLPTQHQQIVSSGVFSTLLTEVRPKIEKIIATKITRTYAKPYGFDFDVEDRSIPCSGCQQYHDNNMYSFRVIITSCGTLCNYSASCQEQIVNWQDNTFIKKVLRNPCVDDPYAEMYEGYEAFRGNRIVYDGERFLLNNGNLWKEQSHLKVSKSIKDLAKTVLNKLSYKLGQLRTEQDKLRGKKGSGALEEAYNSVIKGWSYVQKHSNIDAITKSARLIYYDEMIAELMDKDPDLFGCADGAINLKSGYLETGNDIFVSRAISTQWKGLDFPTTLIDEFMNDIFNHDADVVRYVQMLLGYGITGHISEQCWGIFYGSGSNGKGVLNTILQELLGDYYLSMHKDCVISNSRRTSEGAAAPHMAELQGKRIAICDESAEDDVLNDDSIKLATGGSRINCRRLHQNPISFTPTHLPILMTNFRPRMNIDDDAMVRRIVTVPFVNKYMGKARFDPSNPSHRRMDPSLVAKLTCKNGKEQLLVWLVKGAVNWYREGLGVPPAALQASTQEYIADNDAVGGFIRDHCIVDSKSSVGVTEFREAYNAASDTPLDSKRLKKKMQIRGFVYKQVKTCGEVKRIYQGVMLK